MQNQHAILHQQAQLCYQQGKPDNYKTILCKFYAEGILAHRQDDVSSAHTAPIFTSTKNAGRKNTLMNGLLNRGQLRHTGPTTTTTTSRITSTCNPTSNFTKPRCLLSLAKVHQRLLNQNVRAPHKKRYLLHLFDPPQKWRYRYQKNQSSRRIQKQIRSDGLDYYSSNSLPSMPYIKIEVGFLSL